jgi:predicted CopG family antitoxin
MAEGMTAGRTRYELTHPVLSIRVSKEIYDELQERRRNGQSYADILRIGLGKQKVETEYWQKQVEELTLECLKLEEILERCRGMP